MTFWQKHKWKIIVPVLIVLALAAAFTLGDRDMPKQKDTSEQPTVADPVETPEQDTAAADVLDDVETGPVETRAESTPEPSGDRRQENLHRLIPNSQNTFRRRKSRQVQPANMKKWAA